MDSRLKKYIIVPGSNRMNLIGFHTCFQISLVLKVTGNDMFVTCTVAFSNEYIQVHFFALLFTALQTNMEQIENSLWCKL